MRTTPEFLVKRYCLCALLVLASLTVTSGLQAQYRWNVVRPAKVDENLYRAPLAISCFGDNCTATEVTFSPTTGNTNLVLSSRDGGLTWTQVATDIPQWEYVGSGRNGLYYEAAQQIDSLTAVIGSRVSGVLVITHDGWKSWEADTTYYRGIAVSSSVRGIKFANVAEGMLLQGFGLFWSTVDSGKSWQLISTGYGTSFESYGDSTFRIFEPPGFIFTTHNNWRTRDTTRIAMNGPLADTSFHPMEFVFGRADSAAALGWRWDTTSRSHVSMRLALSTDLGANWHEADVPMNNGLQFPNTSLLGLNWEHMVLAGFDSSGRIVHSMDRGKSWQLETVPLSNGMAYHTIYPVAVAGSGRVLAAVQDTASFNGSASLVYLEKVSAAVEDADRNRQYLYAHAYPNPVHDRLSLKLLGMYVGSVSELRSRICDLFGRTVRDLSKLAQDGSNGDYSEFDVNVHDLTPGVYFLSYSLGGAEYVKPFLKQ